MFRHTGQSRSLKASKALADVLHNEVTAWLVLGLSLTLTVLAWVVADHATTETARQKFTAEAQEAALLIKNRMRDYEQALRGGVSLIQATEQVDRRIWALYVQGLNLKDILPGVQGLGYARMLKPDEVARHEERVRREGLPDYHVWPVEARNQYSAIEMLEPMDERNRRAIGYDMYSEPVRRQAMDVAMDHADTALSGLVTLKQENGVDPQPGFLMYLPVYKTGDPPADLQARRASIDGFVYSPFRAGDLMKGVLGRGAKEIDFELYDDRIETPAQRLYATDSVNTAQHGEPLFEVRLDIDLPGRQWLAVFRSTPYFESNTLAPTPRSVLVGGLTIDFLLFLVISSLSRQRRILRQANEQLRASEARFTALVTGMQNHFGFFRTDGSGRLTYTSPTLGRLLGLKDLRLGDSLIGKARSDEPEGELVRALAQALALKTSTRYRRHVRTGADARMTVEGFNHVVLEEDGHIRSIEGVVQDITQRQSNEEELTLYRDRLQELVRERTRELQAANAAKSRFLANMSHEIRTPLNVIIGFNTLLQSHLTEPGPLAILRDMAQESQRLLSMLDDVLSFTRMESGALRSEPREFNVNAYCREVIDSHRNRATAKSLALQLDIDNNVPARLKGEVAHHRQVLRILLDNAIKFTDTGTVTLGIHTQARPDGRCDLVATVKDTGVGFDTALLDQVFAPFEQADNTETRAYGGVGLGLALGKRLTQWLGGTLVAKSTLGVGSEFTFTVPFDALNKPDPMLAAETASKAPAAYPDWSAHRVLVVEDNLLNQEVIKAFLKRLKLQIEVCTNGQEAVNRMQQEPSPDLVLMDLHMPVMNGLEATRHIRAIEGPVSKVPIVALTAAALAEDEAASREAGMDDFLTKPVNMATLVSTLRRYLPLAQTADQT